ncbi:MAG: sulfur carrier protein ThiS [Succinatimonas sp.]|nr:sulfur carrier protein ThiS [Succinatimonas sp.]
MHISINDELKETNSTTLLELIESLALPSQGVAVAFDGEIVPKNNWEQFELKEGMALDIYNMVAGG